MFSHFVETRRCFPPRTLLCRYLCVVGIVNLGDVACCLVLCRLQVPDVAKPGVIQFMENASRRHGYNLHYNKKVVTGHYGCPQTRRRLIVTLALQKLTLPEMPGVPSLTPPCLCPRVRVRSRTPAPVLCCFGLTLRCYELIVWLGRRGFLLVG